MYYEGSTSIIVSNFFMSKGFKNTSKITENRVDALIESRISAFDGGAPPKAKIVPFDDDIGPLDIESTHQFLLLKRNNRLNFVFPNFQVLLLTVFTGCFFFDQSFSFLFSGLQYNVLYWFMYDYRLSDSYHRIYPVHIGFIRKKGKKEKFLKEKESLKEEKKSLLKKEKKLKKEKELLMKLIQEKEKELQNNPFNFLVSFFFNFRLTLNFLFLGSLFFETSTEYPVEFSNYLYELYERMFFSFISPAYAIHYLKNGTSALELGLKYQTKQSEISFYFENRKDFQSCVSFLENELSKNSALKTKTHICIKNKRFFGFFYEKEGIFFSNAKNGKNFFLFSFQNEDCFHKWGTKVILFAKKKNLEFGKHYNCYHFHMKITTMGFASYKREDIVQKIRDYVTVFKKMAEPTRYLVADFWGESRSSMVLTSNGDPNLHIECKFLPKFLSGKKYGLSCDYLLEKKLANFLFQDVYDLIISSKTRKIGKKELKKAFQNAFIKTHSETSHLFLNVGLMQHLTMLWQFGLLS
uniref:hypothetical protein n=1 Tax=Gormaniella terricola TaxID=2904618 RepID=UPI0021CCA271|nr:hypothetical protein ODF01_pgp068 [Gormaniella terricola]UWV18235.1 hypothetical protein [Gormaniella terricola]